eukprot:2990543-Prymnesium_polylepis.1
MDEGRRGPGSGSRGGAGPDVLRGASPGGGSRVPGRGRTPRPCTPSRQGEGSGGERRRGERRDGGRGEGA